ncbi:MULTISPECIES: hypothetical protein [Streptomyces]|uniref:Uncharacterized protein n=1 Tax=Streptomyces lichenis TaxID=2306967 RepID=A0ABT0I804_9ACTN|nr:hypothetical protein [Streptomyces lichenis]MCK8677448.1 hypothetical protein [Streptomyces lichenis]
MALDGGNQSNGTVGYSFAEKGDAFWFALPLPSNASGKDLRVVGAEISDLPEGLEVVRYGAFDLNDTEGIPLLLRDGDPGNPEFDQMKDHSQGFTVKARKLSDYVYMAKLKITGKVQKNGTSCRYRYRQGGETYTQSLRCSFSIRLKK